ncbi:MAG: cell division protein FtsH, partial [Solobacterium sp.]|nr:cell division protein FtsH [Solobacterium sp.]
MNQVDKPKKPLIYYYAVVMLAIALLNLFLIPSMNQKEIRKVDYGTFMKATENHEIKEVQIESNKILYTMTDDEEQIYETGLMNDPG